MELRISTQDRQESHILAAYESVIWQPSYNEPGTFSIVIDRQYYKYFKEDSIVEVGIDNMYQGLFEYMTDLDELDSQTVTIQGHFLTQILNRRVFTDYLDYDNIKLETFINNMMAKTFLSSDPKRRMNFVVDYYPTSLKNLIVTVTSEPSDLLTLLYAVGQEYEFGVNVFLDDNCVYHLQLYKGEDKTLGSKGTPIILSKDWDTAYQIIYTYSNENHKTFAYSVAGPDEDRRVYHIEAEDVSGLKRREVVFMSGIYLEEDMSDSAYRSQVESEIKTMLLDYGVVELLECEISDKYQYRSDINIGDIVTVDSLSLGLEVSSRILSAEEVWDKTGYTVSVSIGSSARLVRYIRRV